MSIEPVIERAEKGTSYSYEAKSIGIMLLANPNEGNLLTELLHNYVLE